MACQFGKGTERKNESVPERLNGGMLAEITDDKRTILINSPRHFVNYKFHRIPLGKMASLRYT